MSDDETSVRERARAFLTGKDGELHLHGDEHEVRQR